MKVFRSTRPSHREHGGARYAALVLLAGALSVAAPPGADAAAPGPQLWVNDVAVTEGDSGYVDLVFTVSLTNPTGKTITVDYATSDGSATGGSDYQPKSGQLVFNKRETVRTIAVPVYGDTTYEGAETLILTLSKPAGATIADGSGIGTIRENDPQNFGLNVSLAGDGTGSVSGSGITCPSDCSESYAPGTSVTLTAAPGSGSTFSGWSGDCTGSGSCTVTMSQARNVTATFAAIPPSYLLSVTIVGDGDDLSDAFGLYGTGTVTSNPSGIACDSSTTSSDCSESYVSGTLVTLTATPRYACSSFGGGCGAPGTGVSFTGWGGACASSGTNPTCTVTMSEARTVTATFTSIVNGF